MFFLGLLVLLVGVVISIALHEVGHMLPAKRFGALVPEYWVGFGPTVWKTTRGDTTYGVKALPLGGYVRILGMFSPYGSGPKRRRDGQLTLAETARQQSQRELDDAARAGQMGEPFYRLSTPKKLIVMLGGPLMNLVLALILVAVVVMGIGWNVPSTSVAQVTSEPDGSAGPALAAGIQQGDRIVAWDGAPVKSWEDLTGKIQATTGPVDIQVERGGELESFTVTPATRADGTAYVGIVSALEREKGSVADVFTTVGTQVVMTGKAIVALPVSLYELGRSFFTGEPRDANGVVSIVGVGRMAGEIVGAPASAGAEDTSASGLPGGLSFLDRFALMLSLLGALNVALFAFNLIPLPPLDGGHVAGALWGGIRNTASKVQGKPKPPPADTARMVPLSYGVFAALMVMTVILVVADVVKPITFA